MLPVESQVTGYSPCEKVAKASCDHEFSSRKISPNGSSVDELPFLHVSKGRIVVLLNKFLILLTVKCV